MTLRSAALWPPMTLLSESSILTPVSFRRSRVDVSPM
jgi:hypothetical protein